MAFEKLPKGTVEALLQPENRAQLVAILKFHVVAGKVLARDALNLIPSLPIRTVVAPCRK